MNSISDPFQQKEIKLWRILLIDDDEDDYILTLQMLAEAREGRFSLDWCSSYHAGKKKLVEDQTFDAVICDYDLGCCSGIELIRQAVSQQYPAPILLLSGRGTYEMDVEAMEAGAADYLCKEEMNAAFLERAIRYAIERKKHEQALRKSEERYRTLFSSMLNGFALCEMIFDADGQPVDFRYLEINPAFELLTGLKAQEVIGKTVREAIPGIEPYWIEMYGQVVLTGEPVQFENYVSAINKYYQVFAFRPQENQFAALFIDITQRKQMETELMASQKDLANAQAVSHTGSWRLDVKRNELLWSEETYRMFGVPIGTPLSYESFTGFVHPEDREYVDRSWMSALAGEPYDIEHRICVGDQVKWVRERAVLEFDPQGVLSGGFGTVQDITNQRRLEQENSEHQTEMEIHHRLMEFREKERQEIARDLHDGPVQDLSSVIFNIQVLRENLQNPEIQLELDKIRFSIKSVLHDLRKMMNEMRPPSLIRFGLRKAIENHIEDLLERYPRMKIHQDLEQDENKLPENINLALFQIYHEAVSNAIHNAEATKLWVRFSLPKDRAFLEIRDNGRGFILPKEWRDQTQIGHFGILGMKERAEAIGGQISISSQPGKGTSVQVTVPLSVQSE